MFAAAIMWMVGLSFLLGFGVSFIFKLVSIAHPAIWILALIVIAAIVIGGLKARYILIKYADKAVARIEHRGRACFFGFFGWTSWGFILVMMGTGVVLRQFTPLPRSAGGLAFLAVLYIAVGTGLAIADRIFWISALRSEEVATHKAS
jgi:xanthosine utilization system XapX-like protein